MRQVAVRRAEESPTQSRTAQDTAENGSNPTISSDLPPRKLGNPQATDITEAPLKSAFTARRGASGLAGERLWPVSGSFMTTPKRSPVTQFFAAIRAARKAYQTNGTIPDWETLAHAAEAARQVAH